MRLWRLVVAFLLGVLVGSTLMTVHNGRHIEHLMYTVRSLDEELTAANRELDTVRGNLSDERRRVVGAIRVEVRLPPDLTSYEERAARFEIEKTVKEWLEPLYGQDTATLNFVVIPQIIDGREVSVDGADYRLQTRLVYIAEEMVVYVEGTPVPADGDPVP